ncbi:helix-turn-helix domain-containing protein [Nocardia sp. NPDC058058]|uniref:helix-turn-helix domain-containing protein n=1 Tax=Nocardia sp. NPDC058058 TaxID=3346317 RepID=UPI0036D9D3C6
MEAARAKIEVASTPAASRRRKRPSSKKAASRTPQKVERRLSKSMIEELIQGYRDGSSTAELASRYGVSKSAVLALLTKRGTSRRYQSMTVADVARAEQLYLNGHSLTACSKLTGFPASSINRALNKRGTSMRLAGRPSVTDR